MKHQSTHKLVLRILLLLCLLHSSQVRGFLDYTNDSMASCSVEYTGEEREQKFKLHKIDQYVIIILAPISILMTLGIMLIFLKYKQSRKQPSDIIFFVNFSDLILSIHWLTSALYTIVTDSVPLDNDLFCEINSFFSTTSGAIEYIYNLLFCIFLVTRIRNSIKGFRLKKSVIHVFTIAGSIAFYLYLKLSNRTKLNLYGMCSYKVDDTSWIMGSCVVFVYLIMSWSTIIYFKTYVPNNSVFRKHRSDFIKFYYYYVLSISISWSILVASNIIVGLNCVYQLDAFLNIFITIGNIAKLVTPIILSLVRYTDPTLQECINIHRNRKNTQTISNELQNLSLTTVMINKSNGTDSQRVSQNSDNNSSSYGARKLSSWSHVISANLRIMRIQSILLGLFMQDEFIDQQLKKIEKEKNQYCVKVYDKKVLDDLPEDYRQQLNNQKFDTHKMRIKMYFPLHFKQLREKDAKYVNIKKNFDLLQNLQSFSNMAITGDGGRSGELLFFNHDNSILMKTISHQDVQSFEKIAHSYFDYVINKNPDTFITKIYGLYSFTRSDARDSKTYIIFMRNLANIPSNCILRRFDLKGSRYDREVLVKHKIKAEQLPNYTNIEAFENQYKNMKELQIIHEMDINDVSFSTDSRSNELEDKKVVTSTKIAEERYKMQVSHSQLSNSKSKSSDSCLSDIHSSCKIMIPNWIELYNQSIFRQQRSSSSLNSCKQNVNVAKITLKDLDFEKLEKQVYINSASCEFVKQNLLQDSLFFKENGLIDYSLLIFKVFKNTEDYNNQNPDQNEEHKNGSNIFKSIKEQDVYYHIGIIDYLQQWNIDKLLEQKAKQALHANLNLNVSSQNPDTYQSRFKQNIIDSFF